MEKTIDQNQQLETIHRMISQAKGNYAKNSSFHFLFWGWFVALAALSHFVLLFTDFLYPFAVWALSIPGIFVSVIYGFRQSRKAEVKTHYDRIYAWIWFAFIIKGVIIQFFGATFNYQFTPFFLMFAGSALIVSGITMKFRPLIIGAVINYAGSIVAFLVPIQYQLLVQVVCVITGYLIPGYLLKNRK